MRVVYRVYETEHERGWGQRPDGHTDFTSYEKAKAWADKINDHPDGTVPDIYNTASEPRLIDLDVPAKPARKNWSTTVAF